MPDGLYTHYHYDFNGNASDSHRIDLSGHKNINTYLLHKILKYDEYMMSKDENGINLLKRTNKNSMFATSSLLTKSDALPSPLPFENLLVDAHNLIIKAKLDIPF